MDKAKDRLRRFGAVQDSLSLIQVYEPSREVWLLCRNKVTIICYFPKVDPAVVRLAEPSRQANISKDYPL